MTQSTQKAHKKHTQKHTKTQGTHSHTHTRSHTNNSHKMTVELIIKQLEQRSNVFQVRLMDRLE